MRQLRPECGDELVRLHVAHAEVRDDADAARPLDAVAGAHRDAVPLGEAAREGRVRVPGQVYLEQVGLRFNDARDAGEIGNLAREALRELVVVGETREVVVCTRAWRQAAVGTPLSLRCQSGWG